MGRVLTLILVVVAAVMAFWTAVRGDVSEAESALAAGDYRSAYQGASAAIEENQVDLRARLVAGMAGLRLLNAKPRVSIDEVEDHFRMVLDLAPDTSGIHYLLGFTLFQKAEHLPKRRKYEAPALYEETAKLFAEELTRPTANRTSAIQGLAVSLARLGRVDEALEAHDAWIAAQPTEPGPYMAAIKLAVAERRAEKSVALLERASDAIEEELPGLFELGLECAREDEMLKVLDTISGMLETPWERSALDLIYFDESNRPDLAAAALDDLVASSPPEPVKKMLSSHFRSTYPRYTSTESAGSGLVLPERRKYAYPSYPELGRKARVEATVIAVGIVRRNGTPDFFWANSDRTGLGFEKATLDAIAQWEYEPGTLEGEPIDFFFVVRIDFNLS